MLESIVLGIIQGIFEWLPVSSEGIVVLVKVNFFRSGLSVNELISYALFLHLGTFLASFLYFRKDVWLLIKTLFRVGQIGQKNEIGQENRKLLKFLIFATIISGVVGLIILIVLGKSEEDIPFSGKWLTLIIGVLLLITAFVQFRQKQRGKKEVNNLKFSDSVILGIVQGFSILPGLSRSGLTVSAFLLRKFNSQCALRLSFLMSLPVILGGNIILNFKDLSLFSFNSFIAFIFSFLFGFLTIHLLLKTANKLNFAWFVLVFGLITILFAFV